jgi:hypothetical protein
MTYRIAVEAFNRAGFIAPSLDRIEGILGSVTDLLTTPWTVRKHPG